MHIKVDDTVTVLAGSDRGVNGKVLKVNKDRGLILVERVNVVLKHMKRSRQNPRGGRLEKEMPIAISNVLLLCPKCNQATRTGARTNADGTKHRYCKKCQAEIGQLSKIKKQTSAAKSR